MNEHSEPIKYRDISEFQISQAELHELRTRFPKIHLYDHPVIGTESVRQFIYCPRIVFFRYVLHTPMQKTYKMEVGEQKHEKLQRLKNKSDDDTMQKYYNVYLSDGELGLVGLIDYFEFDGNEAFPVEIKSGNQPPKGLDLSHKSQVVAQAILIEKNFNFLVKKVRIYYIKHQKIVDHAINIEEKMKVIKIVREIQDLLKKEVIPEPTPDIGKCTDCECRKYCYR